MNGTLNALTIIGFASIALLAARTEMATAAHVRGVSSTVPDSCKQKTYEVNVAGGSFEIPRCLGVSGKLTYGANNVSPMTTTFSFSPFTATDPDPSVCGALPPSEMAALFMLAEQSSALKPSVTYETATKKSSIVDAGFGTGSTFMLFAFVGGVEQFSERLGLSKNGALRFPSPIDGQTISSNVKYCFEVAVP